MKRFICHHSCFIVSKWFIYLMSAPIFGIKLDIGSKAATELNVTFIWQMWMYALKKISNILFEFDIINHNQRQVKISTLESYKGLLSYWLGYFLFWKKKNCSSSKWSTSLLLTVSRMPFQKSWKITFQMKQLKASKFYVDLFFLCLKSHFSLHFINQFILIL